MPDGIWLPYSRSELIAMKRCPDCGMDPVKQDGHKPECVQLQEDS